MHGGLTVAKWRLSNIAPVDLSFNPLNTKLLSVQYLERVVSLSLFVSSASYLLYRVQINALMFSSTYPSTDRNGVNDQTLLVVINSLLRPLKFVYNSTRLVDSCDDSLMRCFFGVIVCRYKRRPTLGAINVLDGQNSWRDSLLHQLSIPKPCISRKHLWGPCRNNIAIRFGMEKLEWCSRAWWRKFEDMITRFETIYINVINSTTDGLTDTAWRAKISDIWKESWV